jgi:hypothetical protein
MSMMRLGRRGGASAGAASTLGRASAGVVSAAASGVWGGSASPLASPGSSARFGSIMRASYRNCLARAASAPIGWSDFSGDGR